MRAFALPLVAPLFAAAITLAFAIAAPGASAQAQSTTPRGEDTPLNLPEQQTVENAAGGGGLVRTIVGLVVVIGVIYGVTWVLKQVKRSGEADQVGRGLAAVSTLPIGPGRTVQLVRAGDEYLLLGVSEGAITTLRSYTAAEAEAAGMLDADDEDFIELGTPRREGPATIGSASADLVERLRKLTVRR